MKVQACLRKVIDITDYLYKNTGKIAGIFALVFMQFIFVSAAAFAQDATTTESPKIDAIEVYKNTEDMKYVMTGDKGASIQSLKQNEQTANLLSATSLLVGTDAFSGGTERAEEVGLDSVNRVGLLGTVDNSVTAMLINPPGVDLDNHLARQWLPGAEGSSTSVYAATSGGYVLLQNTGLEQIWEMFRNFAYAGFVFVIIAAGFMIMFRSKIGGQVSVSIMNTLPSVIIGLIMVTFSFAIVGFVLDLGRLITALLSSYMASALSGTGFQLVGLSDPFNMARDAFLAMSPFGTSAGDYLGALGVGMAGGGVVGAIFGGGIGALIGAAVGAVVFLIILLVVAAIALYASIRVFVTLVTAYIKIILDLVLGPVYILLGSLPGRTNSIMDWLKRLFGNVLVFPVVFFIINLGRYIAVSPTNAGAMTPIDFMNVGDTAPSGISFKAILVIAAYFIAASAPAIISDMIGVSESKGMGAALGETKKAASRIPLVGGLFS